MHLRRKQAFTLVEMLVVIAIIGILAALLLPAVQSARRTARKAQCANRMRNIALACLTFESSRQRFPGYQERVAVDRSGTLPGRNKPASWVVMLFPFIEEQDTYNLWDDPNVPLSGNLTPYIDFLVCPSRTSSSRQDPILSYVANSGLSVGTPDDNGWWIAQRPENGVFHDRINTSVGRSKGGKNYRNETRVTDMRDGTSATLLISENLNTECLWNAAGPLPSSGSSGGWESSPDTFDDDWGGRYATTFVWLYRNETSTSSGAAGSPLFGTSTARPAPTTALATQNKINGEKSSNLLLKAGTARPSSHHAGGVNVAFADNHTTFLSQDIAYTVYQQLMTPLGRNSDMPQNLYLLKDKDFK